jgi:hypothetical protein
VERRPVHPSERGHRLLARSLDRSTDLLPNLIGLSMVEFWHGVRGLTARLDQRITADIRSTIEAIESPSDTRADLEIATI